MAVSFRGPRNTGLSPSVSTKCGAHPDLLDTTAPPLLLLLGASQPMAWGAQSQGGWGVAHPCSSTRSRNGPAPSPGPPCAGNTHLGQGQGRCSPEGIKTPWRSAGLAESRATRSSSLLPPGSFPGERRPPSSLQGAPQGSADRAWGTGTASPLPVTRGQWRGIHQGGTDPSAVGPRALPTSLPWEQPGARLGQNILLGQHHLGLELGEARASCLCVPPPAQRPLLCLGSAWHP